MFKKGLMILVLIVLGSPLMKKVSAAEEKYSDMVLVPAGEFTMGENTRYN